MPHVALLAAQTKAVQVRNIFCIGRNYSAHIAELGNRPEEDPVVFIKPTSALHVQGKPIVLPVHSSEVHYEAELVLLVGKDFNPSTAICFFFYRQKRRFSVILMCQMNWVISVPLASICRCFTSCQKMLCMSPQSV